MELNKAISIANMLRPNDIADEKKAEWVMEVERGIAEMMCVEAPVNLYPEDMELLMPTPYDNIYELYLCAMIDFANQEGTLYQNDFMMYNSALAEAKAWYRRHNVPDYRGNWRTM